MPWFAPLIVIAGSAFIIGAGITGWAALAVTLLSVGAASLWTMAHGPTPEPQIDQERIGSQHWINTRSVEVNRALIYGTCKVGVNVEYIGVSGDDQEWIHIIGTIGEGEINGIHQEGGVDQLFLDDKIYTDFPGHVYYELKTGTSSQNATTGEAGYTIPDDWNDPMRYTAYIYMRIKYNQDYFQSVPNITLVIEGLKLWDPTDDTDTFTDNNALVVYDMLTRPSYRGGMGLDAHKGPVPESAKINISSFDDAKDYCDNKLISGQSVPWVFNAPITQNRAIADNIKLVLACFRGELIDSDGKFKLLYREFNDEAVVMDLTEDDILTDRAGKSTFTVKPQENYGDVPNAIKASYLDPNNGYDLTTFTKTDTDAVTSDGDYREQLVALYGLNSLDAVEGMCNYILERRRFGRIASFIARSKAIPLEPMDMITVSNTIIGWDEQECRVLTVAPTTNGTVALVVLEENASLYDDAYNLVASSWYETTLPDPSATVPSVINATATEVLYNFRGRTFTRLEIGFLKPPPKVYPWWDYVEVYVKVDSGLAAQMNLYLPFSEGTGLTVRDHSEHNNDGTFTNMEGDEWDSGIIGGAVTFDANDEEITIDHSDTIDITTGDFSISMWIKVPATADLQYPIHKMTGSRGYFVYISSASGYPRIRIYDAGGNVYSRSITAINDGEWHHIVFTLDRDGNCLTYINGALDNTYGFSARQATLANAADFIICETHTVNISITQIRFYKGRILSSDDVDNLYNLPSTEEWKYQGKVESSFTIDPAQEGSTYLVKIRSVSIHNAKESFGNAVTVQKLILGKTAAPSDMTYLNVIQTNDVVNIRGDEVSDPDVEIYEFRIANSDVTDWNGAWLLATARKPDYSISGMRPGTFKVFCKPLDTSGNYADTAVTATFTIQDPHGYALDSTEDIDQGDAGDSFYPTILYDEMAAVGDWVDTDAHNGVSTFGVYDGVTTLNLDTNVAEAGNNASRYLPFSGTMESPTSLQMRIHTEDIGTYANGDYLQILMSPSTAMRFRCLLASDGIYIYDGSSWNEVGTNEVHEGTWQTWRFVIHHSIEASATCDVYVDDAGGSSFTLIEAGVDCSYTLEVFGNRIYIYQHGFTTNDQLSHIDYVKIGDAEFSEMYDKGGGDYVLRVDHTSTLTGTYTSREIDLGSNKDVRVAGDFITSIVNASTTWTNLFPAPDKWNDNYDPLTQTWAQIFGQYEASQLTAKLKWGTVSGVYPNEADLFHLHAVDAYGARYFRVEVTITDPNISTYLYLDGSGGDTILTLKFWT